MAVNDSLHRDRGHAADHRGPRRARPTTPTSNGDALHRGPGERARPHGTLDAQRRRLLHLHAGAPTTTAPTASPTRPTTATPTPTSPRSPSRSTSRQRRAGGRQRQLHHDRGHAADHRGPRRAEQRHRRRYGDASTAVLVTGPAQRHADAATPTAPSPTRRRANYNGPDSFTYKANDGDADSNVATVTITVNAASTTRRWPSTTAYTRDRGHAADDRGPRRARQRHRRRTATRCTAVLVSRPGHTARCTLQRRRHLHLHAGRPNYNGTDSFTYKANDGDADSQRRHGDHHGHAGQRRRRWRPTTATAPTEDTPLTVAAPGVLANDTDVDGRRADARSW